MQHYPTASYEMQRKRAGFAVIETAAQNLSYQQNLTSRELTLVVLRTNEGNVRKQVSSRSYGSFQAVANSSARFALFAFSLGQRPPLLVSHNEDYRLRCRPRQSRPGPPQRAG